MNIPVKSSLEIKSIRSVWPLKRPASGQIGLFPRNTIIVSGMLDPSLNRVYRTEPGSWRIIEP